MVVDLWELKGIADLETETESLDLAMDFVSAWQPVVGGGSMMVWLAMTVVRKVESSSTA